MTIETQQIVKVFSEVQDLSAQYKAEVPSNRGAWPVSIRERITKLRELNVPALAIARKTGIPTPTIVNRFKSRAQTGTTEMIDHLVYMYFVISSNPRQS